MNIKSKEHLEVCLKIDDKSICQCDEKIDDKSIVKSAKHIEKLLISHNAKADKIQNVFELTVEIMQNMLNYSYGNIDLNKHKKEAYGRFQIAYRSKTECYFLESCNLVSSSQKIVIQQKLDELKNLDSIALRTLAREKMRSKKDKHEKGAGLGFIMMARKSNGTLKANFKNAEEGIEKFHLSLLV